MAKLLTNNIFIERAKKYMEINMIIQKLNI